MIDEVFPKKKIKIQDRDKPFFTEDLRKLRRRKMREYSLNNKSEKFIFLEQEYKNLLRSEIAKYKNKLISQVREGRLGSCYKSLRQLETLSGEMVFTF